MAELNWSCSFGGAVIRPKTAKAKAYCKENGSYFKDIDAYFVEGYGQFYGSSEPTPPKDCTVLLEFAEAPCLGGLSPKAKRELCEYWGLLNRGAE